MILADTLGIFADAAFSNPSEAGTIGAWIGIYAFAFQIYFDFSGYTDMALGCATLLGYDLPENFRQPYAAWSVTDFWRRWHITLSTWLRDYLYIPLGGSRSPGLGVYRNLMITMLLGGLWHGAAWNFLIWGGLQGALLCLERAFNIRGHEASFHSLSPSRRTLIRCAVFNLIVFTWIPFRSPSVDGALSLIAAMFNAYGAGQLVAGHIMALGIVAWAWVWQVRDNDKDLRAGLFAIPTAMKYALYGLTLMSIAVFSSQGSVPFIYFQF